MLRQQITPPSYDGPGSVCRPRSQVRAGLPRFRTGYPCGMARLDDAEDPKRSEARRNYAAYKENFQAQLERDEFGRIALLSGGELIAVYDDRADAYSIGCEKFGLGGFSLQEIGAQPVRLGIMAAAFSP